MSKYDFTFLLVNDSEEKEIKKLITDQAGSITDEKNWGKKMLAYPINKETSATYYNWQIEMEPAKMTELKRKLGFSDSPMRYLILKVD